MNILIIAKQKLWMVFVVIGLAFSGSVSAQPGVSVPIESFYNELAPYGQWMQYPGYGDVWLPNAGPNFQPYATAGHWIMTDYGNTWVSDYPWGWAAFHYGRWIYDPAYGGWLWIPGPDWAPAWVDWRSGGGYYGWAPLGPNWGVGIQVNIPAPFWTFVPQVYINSPYVYNYYVPRPSVVNIYQRTAIINNVYRSSNWAYNYGPPRGDIERITRQPVQVYRIDRMDRPGRSVIGNGSVGFYHPGGGYGQSYGYGRGDRYDNPNRPSYGGNYPGNRSGGYYGNGNNTPNRAYPGNNTPDRAYPGNNQSNREYGNTPNPGFDGNRNNTDRGGFGNNPSTSNPNGGNNAPTTPNNPQPDRQWGGRGSYSPGGGQPGGYNQSPGNGQPGGYNQGSTPPSQPPSSQPAQPSGRPFDRMERGGGITPQAAPGNQGGGQEGWNMHSPQGREGGGTVQQAPAQGQPSQPSGRGTFGGERGRGPR